MIKRIFPKIGRTGARFSKGAIWAVSVIFAFILLMQIAVTAGILWLNSDAGQAFIQAQIDNATADTGYVVTVTPVSYSFPNGFKFGTISVADAGGVIADIENLVIRPGVIGLGVRSLSVSVNAETVTMYRMPQSNETDADATAEPTPIQGFTLPDIYFTRIALDDLRIGRLDIRESVFGTELVFSPRLNTVITLGNNIRVDLSLINKSVQQVLPAWLPERIVFYGRLNPQTLDADIGRLDIRNDVLRIMAVGEANIGAAGIIDVAVNGRVADFSAFAQGVEGRGEVKAVISGTVDAPMLNLDGRVALPLLAMRGLDDIVFAMTMDDVGTPPQGKFRTHTAYQGHDVELTSDFIVENNVLELSAIQGSAPDLVLQGNANINLDTTIVQGRINIELSNLGAYSALAGVDIAGRLKSDINLQNNNGVQGALVNADVTEAAYEDIRLDRATVQTQLSDIKKLWPDNLDLKADSLHIGDGVAVTSANVKINAEGQDNYGLTLSMNGEAIQAFTLGGTAKVQGIQAARPSVNNIDLTLSSAQAKIVLTGKADMDSLDITLRTRDFGLGSLPVSLPDQVARLSLDADAGISGLMAAPVIVADMTISPLNITKQGDIRLSMRGRYENRLARIDVTGQGDGIKTMNGHAELPFELSFAPFVFNMPETTPLDGRIVISAKAEELVSLFLPVDHSLSGELDINGMIAGTVGNPDISGTANLTDGLYRFNPYGVALSDITINTDLRPDSLRIERLTASDGKKGQLRGEGFISFDNPQNTDIDITLNNFYLLDSNKAEGTLSADLGLQGGLNDYLLSGDITLGQFDVVIPERFQSNIPELNVIEKEQETAATEPLRAVALDISVVADNHIFVRGWGLDAEFGGTIDIGGTLDDPKLNGELNVRRGRYEEFGQRFELERAYLRFQGSVPPSPYLDIIATTRAGEIDAAVNLSGEIGKPSIKLSSTPALPEDEILSHILFGKNLERITLFQAVQLKQTLDRFTGRGGGGFDAVGTLRNLTGLDDIRVDTDEEGESSVGVGKYLSDEVYLELEKGAGEGSGSAKIQVELTPNINLESKIGQDAQAGAGVMWRWDY